MAVTYKFGNDTITIPGAYSRIKSGINNPPLSQDSGTTLIIDTGLGAEAGGGSGISGEIESGKDAIYSVQRIEDAQAFWKRGIYHALANPLFRPLQTAAVDGVSTLYIIRAAETTAAVGEFNPVGGSTDGGDFEIQTRSEGLIGNGTIESGDLIKGFAFQMEAGVDDPDKFVLKFYRGTFAGEDTDGIPFGRKKENSPAELLVTSIEFDNAQEVLDWMNTDNRFNQFFRLKTGTVNGDGTIDSTDLTTYSDLTAFTGGTESYTADATDAALEAANELNVRFILAGDDESDAQSADNVKLQEFCENTSKFNPELYIGGGADKDNFRGSANSTEDTCEFFDSDHVTVVHGRPLVFTRHTGTGLREYPTVYKAAILLGREAGVSPQIPLTFKSIAISGEKHKLTQREMRQGIEFGALMTVEDNGLFEVVKGINSLQANDFLVNEDGTTSSKQIKRIARQMNAELKVNIKNDLLRVEGGVNRNTLSADDYAAYIDSYLRSITAQTDEDNLILSHRNIQIEVQEEAYFAQYEFEPNFEVGFLFSTGFIIDPSS